MQPCFADYLWINWAQDYKEKHKLNANYKAFKDQTKNSQFELGAQAHEVGAFMPGGKNVNKIGTQYNVENERPEKCVYSVRVLLCPQQIPRHLGTLNGVMHVIVASSMRIFQ